MAGRDYSRIFLVSAENGTLLDMYHHRGYWEAQFDPPSLDARTCAGVAVTLNVREGAAYTWRGAAWSGNSVQPAHALDSLLGLKEGEIADGKKLDTGLLAIHAAYGRQGYILQNATYTPDLDVANHQATFRISVTEGGQFRMGQLTFEGVSPEDAKRLAARFKLKTGDVYDAGIRRSTRAMS